MKKIGLFTLIVLWAGLVLFAWFGPKQETSLAERRQLAQMPEITGETIFDGSFMKDFEKYSLDQFPLRDTFRSLKAVMHYYVLGQRDNNGIYIAEDHVAEIAYPLDTDSVDHALKQFNLVYDLYLQDSRVYATVVPDKGYYLAQQNGYPSLDYEELFSRVEEGMPWATYVDITGALSLKDYYYTDTHWKQENLDAVAQTLATAMGVSAEQDYTLTALERPFYGVYYGQAALPLPSETMYIVQSDLLEQCTVYNYTTGKETGIYDMDKLESNDLYEVYLSGAQSLLRIENPNATTDRELVVFRDSYGSSLVPLLVKDYAAVTLVDIRYIFPQFIGQYVDFADKDVLFMYSSLVLNKNLI